MSGLPFARLNLRRNPFGEPPPEDRSFLLVGGLEDWPGFLAGGPEPERTASNGFPAGGHPRNFLQFLGPSGCGKTTRLRALQERFPDSPMVAWCPVRGWPPLPTSCGGTLFVDDAQELSGKLLGRLLRFESVAVATQKDLAEPFRRFGFSVRTVKVGGLVSPSGLRELVERRLEWARRRPGEVPRVGRHVLEALVRRHGSDLRSIQSDLYDWYQQLEVEE